MFLKNCRIDIAMHELIFFGFIGILTSLCFELHEILNDLKIALAEGFRNIILLFISFHIYSLSNQKSTIKNGKMVEPVPQQYPSATNP
jgi:hypothetical protein